MIVLVTGKARAGKGEVAKHLVEKHGFVELQFSSILKEAALALNPIVKQVPLWKPRFLIFGKKFDGLATVRLQQVVRDHGWHEAKKEPEVRSLLQKLGTEVGRNLFGENFWLNLTMKKVRELRAEGQENVVISDNRFDNEAKKGDVVLRVLREVENDLGVNAAHASEAGVSNELITADIDNNGTLEELRRKVDKALSL